MNHGDNSTTMEDLDDHMLTQILLKLPSCRTVLACSPVNKRWCSLIFDPNFPVQLANHKKKTTTLFKGSGFDHEDDEPPWTFLINMIIKNRMYSHNVNNEREIIPEFIFDSPKLSLEFLPCYTPIARGTFKDLVLCSDYEGGQVYYLTNPLTKQWVALPPCPVDKHRRTAKAALICQSPYNHNQRYKFRVVVVRHPRLYRSPEYVDKFDLVIYCSEIGEWKEIKLRVSMEVGPDEPEIVVSNGIIYYKCGLCLVGLDPFDVNVACGATLEARVLPPLPGFGYLQESSGQLLVVHSPKSVRLPWLLYRKNGTAITIQIVVWKLDPNQAPLVWETTFQGLCKGTVNSNENPRYTGLEGNVYSDNIGVHPYNDKLIYMYLFSKEQLILCDTRTGRITHSKSLPIYMRGIHRLEHQWWPTSVHRLDTRTGCNASQ